MMTRVLTAFLVLATLAAVSAQPSSRFVLASVVDPQTDTPLGGLAAEDFIVQEGTTPCETIAARPAGYPIAILVDTSNAAGRSSRRYGKRCGSWSAGCRGGTSRSIPSATAAFRVTDFTARYHPARAHRRSIVRGAGW
jgi:hypothetical protein